MLPLNQIVLGDCLEVMRGLPDGCVDSVITDPPYGLGKVKNLPALIQAWLSDEDGSAHQTSGFMGKDWDMVPSPTVWREVYRVLKPGGYALVFAGTRTVDLMGLSLRLAGFEISESVNWVFGQGFPKSKKMLKPAHEPILFCYKPGKREDLNIDECRIGIDANDSNICLKQKNHKGGEKIYKGGLNKPMPFATPSLNGRYPSNVILSHTEFCVACGTKRVKTQWGQATERTTSESSKAVYSGGWAKVDRPIGYTAPDGTETIAAYECHPSCPVRLLDEQTAQMKDTNASASPSGRYPANVILSHSPGCVACGTKRVKTESGGENGLKSKESGFLGKTGVGANVSQRSYGSTETIAAYICSEGCPVRLLDEQTAQMRASKSSGNKPGYQYPSDTKGKILGSGTGIGAKKGMAMNAPQDGDGTANVSRFFLNLPPEVPFVYQPKASRKDRTMNGKVNNTHVTVKPTQLMAYLVKLVTPVDGICLDPFAGSGSTALGCIQEGRQFIGIERDPDYHRIACDRLAAASPQSAV